MRQAHQVVDTLSLPRRGLAISRTVAYTLPQAPQELQICPGPPLHRSIDAPSAGLKCGLPRNQHRHPIRHVQIPGCIQVIHDKPASMSQQMQHVQPIPSFLCATDSQRIRYQNDMAFLLAIKTVCRICSQYQRHAGPS